MSPILAGVTSIQLPAPGAARPRGLPPPLHPLERLEALLDPGSLHVIRARAQSRSPVRGQDGDGVVGGSGTIDGHPILCYAQDGRFAGGSLGATGAETILRVLHNAARAGAPVVASIESGGARIDDGTPALTGYAQIFRHIVALSGRVPQITVVSGTGAGGGAYCSALTDFVVMTRAAKMFLTGPGVVQEVTGEAVSAELLGGPAVHARNGVCHLVAADDLEAAAQVRRLLALLPRRAGAHPERAAPEPPGGSDPGLAVPLAARAVYDVRGVIEALLDSGRMLEIGERWARNMVTVLGRLDGRPVGVVANQPRHLGGVIDSEAAQKAARFVRTCNSFGLPLLVLVDTPGFLPGVRQEAHGIIRHGAKLVYAFAEAVVPKITVILRKAYGGGYITMCCRDLGADAALAWPQAEVGIMGPVQAVRVMHRRELEQAPDSERELERLAAEYRERHLSAASAAALGVIDEVIDPVQTRDRLAAALAMFASGATTHRAGCGNLPL